MRQILDQTQEFEERVMMGLRTTHGVDKALLSNRADKVQHLIDEQFLIEANGRIAATDKGFRVLNRLILELISDK